MLFLHTASVRVEDDAKDGFGRCDGTDCVLVRHRHSRQASFLLVKERTSC